MTLDIKDNIAPFELPGVDNQTYTSAQFADKTALVVVFTCNHCPYALAWEGRMLDIQRDYADKGVQVVAINANDANKYPADSFENMVKHARANEWNIPYLYDESQKVAAAYGASRTPEVFLFDGNHKLQYHGKIDDNYEEPAAVEQTYLRDALDALLTGRQPERAKTEPIGCSIKWK